MTQTTQHGSLYGLRMLRKDVGVALVVLVALAAGWLLRVQAEGGLKQFQAQDGPFRMAYPASWGVTDTLQDVLLKVADPQTDSAFKTNLTVGSPFTYHMPDGSPIIEGEVVLSDPPTRLVHTYHSLWPPMNEDAPTKVTWELVSMPGGVTKVTVVHEDFQGETATYQGLQSGGWAWILSNMKTLLETGEAMPQGY